MQAQQQALEAYQNLWNSFPKDELGEPIYPEDYAGAYLDDDGNLIIQLTEVIPAAENLYNLRCVDTEKVRFREAAYSVNELLGFETYVQDYIDAGYEVVTSGISVTNNRFEISLNEDMARFTGPSRTMAARAAGAPIALSYQEPVKATADIKGGDSISLEGGSFGATLGVCGTYNGAPAILTCGHGFSNNNYIQYSGQRLGQIVYARANTSPAEHGIYSLGDFSIAKVTNNTLRTTDKVSVYRVTGTYSSLPVGTKIYKYGRTTGLTYGTVVRNMNLTVHEYGSKNTLITTPYYVRGLYETKMENASGFRYPVDKGDSGGPVFIKNGGTCLIHGVVSARGETPAGTTLMYSTPIYYAMDYGFQPNLG